MIAACSTKEVSPPTAPEPKEATAPNTPSSPPAPFEKENRAKEKIVLKGPGKLLPQKMPDWTFTGAPRYFGPSNLYDLINGGAEIYVELGLKEMVTADYKSKKQRAVTVTLEIYDMGSPLGAFGRVARFLNGQSDPSRAGEGLPEALSTRGLLGDTDLIFWKGRHLVHVTAMDESPEATPESMAKLGKALLPEFATACARAITEDAPFPSEVAAFPKEHLIARTEAWEPKTLAGHADLGPGFSARYQEGETRWTLFVTAPIDDAKALEAKLTKLGGDAAGKKTGALRTSKRIAGYVADVDQVPPKDAALVQKQLEALAAAFRDE
jgi:hypothetical protein